MEGAYYYTYETVNFSKNKYYIGQHCTKDLNDRYFGSCKELKHDVENGDEYEVNILNFYTNIYDLGWAEYILIKERNCVKDSSYYNPNNGLYFNKCFEFGRSEITKQRISKSKIGCAPTKGNTGNKHSAETSIKMKKAWEKRRLIPVKPETTEKWRKSMQQRKLKLQNA